MKLSTVEKNVIKCIRSNNTLTKEEMAELLYVSDSTISKAIKELKQKNIIKRAGSHRNGYWEIINKNIDI